MPRQRTVKLDGVIILTTDSVAAHDERGSEIGWIELGYEAGSIEFTILQVTLHGDWRVERDALTRILNKAVEEVTGPAKRGYT